MMRVLLLVLIVVMAGCQYDPHAHLLTTSEPKTEDVVGLYVLDQLYLPAELNGKSADISVELRADGTFSAKNVPPWELDGPKPGFFESLLSGTGKWEIGPMGTVDPGNKAMFGVNLRDSNNRIMPAKFTGKKAPYGLIFQLGDPDTGDAVLLRRKSP